jgi:hypothetical protein
VDVFLIPLPILALLAVIIAIAVAWWWSSRVDVSEPPTPITMMATRIPFPKLHIADAKAAVEQLERAYEIVIPFEHATLVIAYPLTNPASFPLTAAIPQGFTRAELVKHICDEYRHVYEAEEETAETKTVPRDERGMNRERNRTDGVYGIWGRDLDELLLIAARWTRHSDGKVTIDVFVEDAPRPALEPPRAPA